MKKFKPRIKLITHSQSGCNNRALFYDMPDYITKKYEVKLIEHEIYTEFNEEVDDSEIVVTTHCSYTPKQGQINVELWHGFGPKTLRVMEQKNRTIRNSLEHQYFHFKELNAMISFSPFCSYMLNGAFLASGHVYHVTGMPRNDMLLQGKKKFDCILDQDFSSKKVVFYAPTWRDQIFNLEKSDGSKDWSNVFGFSDFDKVGFGKFLTDNNIVLIIKLHPFEEELFSSKVTELLSDNMYLLTNKVLEEKDVQLYELLGSTDMLMTDYSSIYIDYLLLNKPVVFIPLDLKDYDDSRGLWLTPFDFWAPGPKTYTQLDLEVQMLRSLKENDYYYSQRKDVTNLIHYYTDASSSERVWNMIDDLWEGDNHNRSQEVNEESAEIVLLKNSIKSQINNLCGEFKLDEAEGLIKKLENQVGIDVDIQVMKASIAYLRQDFQSAIWILREANIRFANNIEILFNLAFMYKLDGDLRKSLYYFEKLLNCTIQEQESNFQNYYNQIKENANIHLREINMLLGAD
ncbi:CDP-glycerol glycerophosphotransferase family protein [Paenibacillus sp. BIC5C1]|uniref:CDP-glycerol glycerophosphotransferase family protein n=1 Tax=Paenibacillus sp. BIC5C1 TaxID=3078263 RepID=UPI0028ECACB0|nr:CDP-glycerol glycerophosphotransferase family protein [Paenibacillus sp. BIC5C1]